LEFIDEEGLGCVYYAVDGLFELVLDYHFIVYLSDLVSYFVLYVLLSYDLLGRSEYLCTPSSSSIGL